MPLKSLISKIFNIDKKEKMVLKELENMLDIMNDACSSLTALISSFSKDLVEEVINCERMGDVARRNVEVHLFEGAFLPQARHLFFTLAERMDNIIDTMEDSAKIMELINRKIDKDIQEGLLKIMEITKKCCEMLKESFFYFKNGNEEKMKKKIEEIMLLENKIDDIKHELYKKMISHENCMFWIEKETSDLVELVESISDSVEDAADVLRIIVISMKV